MIAEQSADRGLNNIAFLSDPPAFEKMMANYAVLSAARLLDQLADCACTEPRECGTLWLF